MDSVGNRTSQKASLDFGRLADLHYRTLPDTPSSRAGMDVLESMYRSLAEDGERHFVLFQEGGYASCTLDLEDGEKRIRKNLNTGQFLRLAWQHARRPQFYLAKREFNRVLPRTRFAYILTIGTDRSLPQGKGPSGSALLHALEEYATSRAVSEIWVDTEASNTRAIAFYKRNGYVVERACWGNVLLRKNIHAQNS